MGFDTKNENGYNTFVSPPVSECINPSCYKRALQSYTEPVNITYSRSLGQNLLPKSASGVPNAIEIITILSLVTKYWLERGIVTWRGGILKHQMLCLWIDGCINYLHLSGNNY